MEIQSIVSGLSKHGALGCLYVCTQCPPPTGQHCSNNDGLLMVSRLHFIV